MTEVEFKRLAAQGYNRIPVILETFADLDTPLSIYLKLANKPYSYLLESVQGGERFGRYSFIGLPPPTRIAVRGGTVLVLSGNRVAERPDAGDPLAFIGDLSRASRCAALPGLPRFCGGLVGCFGYDTVRYIEPQLAQSAPARSARHARHPAAAVRGTRHRRQPLRQADLVVYADPACPARTSRRSARLRELLAALRAPVQIPAETPQPASTPRSEFGEDGFKAAVRARQAVHRRRRRHAGGAVAAHDASRSRPRRCRCTARCARSIPRPTCSISTSRTSTSSAPRRRSWCASRATR